jgi:hypothetical protein
VVRVDFETDVTVDVRCQCVHQDEEGEADGAVGEPGVLYIIGDNHNDVKKEGGPREELSLVHATSGRKRYDSQII